MRDIEIFKKFCSEHDGVWPPIFFWEESDDSDAEEDELKDWVFI